MLTRAKGGTESSLPRVSDFYSPIKSRIILQKGEALGHRVSQRCHFPAHIIPSRFSFHHEHLFLPSIVPKGIHEVFGGVEQLPFLARRFSRLASTCLAGKILGKAKLVASRSCWGGRAANAYHGERHRNLRLPMPCLVGRGGGNGPGWREDCPRRRRRRLIFKRQRARAGETHGNWLSLQSWFL